MRRHEFFDWPKVNELKIQLASRLRKGKGLVGEIISGLMLEEIRPQKSITDISGRLLT